MVFVMAANGNGSQDLKSSARRNRQPGGIVSQAGSQDPAELSELNPGGLSTYKCIVVSLESRWIHLSTF